MTFAFLANVILTKVRISGGKRALAARDPSFRWDDSD
jgi:hypothetical protein